MTPTAGWYDDPWDPDSYRYWDGDAWTAHSSPRYIDSDRPPAYPDISSEATTADGVALSGWWRRVVARFLDGIITLVVSLPVTGYFWYHYLQISFDYQAGLRSRGQTESFADAFRPPTELVLWAIPLTALIAMVGAAYEVYFLQRNGATPGKRVMRIRVRLREREELPMSSIGKRAAILYGVQVASVIPAVGTLVTLFALVNYLWPLWDPHRQALHDKVAATNVVRS
ncbi:MAG: RDD family protein [Nocardioidaceae bacterium]